MSLIYRPASYLDRLPLAEMFPKAQPLEVELGAGDGSFLIAWAKANPGRNVLGVERLLGRIRKIERKASRAGLSNVRLMRIEASYFLEYLLPRNSVTALHIYFPDPWPKRKHWKHRLINDAFPALCARVLVADGMVFVRTDDADYFEQITSVFGSQAGFAVTTAPPALAEILTDFEKEFHQRGVRTLAASYKLTT